MVQVTILLLIVNAVFAGVLGFRLARHLARSGAGTASLPMWLLALWGMYLAECVAFSASMATNLLGMVLAVVWGLVFMRKLQSRPSTEQRKDAFLIAMYTCLPAISFVSLLPLLMIGGWSILTVEAGRRFGIPGFVPWPGSCLLGFFLMVAGVAVVFKTSITVGIVSMHTRKPRESRK